MSNSTDPVATLFPLLASKGERPEWIPHDWDSAAWPKEPTREAVLQLVDWHLLCEKYPDPPARQEALRRIGNYWKTLRDVESLLSILRSSGLSRTEMPEAPEDASRNLMVQRLKTLRERLAGEPDQSDEVPKVQPSAEPPEKKRPAKKKRAGRPKPSKEEIEHDARIAEAWKRAHESGVYKSEFARDNGMTISELDALLNRVRMRSNRSH